MPTLQQLEQALIAADKAGDTAAATALAGEMRAAMSAQQGPLKSPNVDPTAGVGAVEAGLAGGWQQLTGRVKSLGNAVGLVSDRELTSNQNRNRALMERTSAKAGAITSDIAATLPLSRFGLPGAIGAGALLGFTDPNAVPGDLGDRGKRALKGAAFSAAGFGLGKWAGNKISERMANAAARKASEAERIATMQAGQKLGLGVPPSTTNPSMTNRAVEAFAGKEAVEQEFALRNATVMQDAMRKYLGLAPGAPLNMQTLTAARQQAGKAYEAAKGLPGTMYNDSQFLQTLTKLEGSAGSASRSFPGLGGSTIRETLAPLRQLQFRGDDAIDAIQALREGSKQAFAGRQAGLGRAQAEAAKALEDLIERNIERQVGLGQVGSDYARQTLEQFRKARIDIAKTYAVEKVINKATGNVQGAKAAQLLAKGAPLTDEMLDVAKFASAFGHATKEPTRSAGVNALRMSFGIGGAVTGHPATMVLPLGGQVAAKVLTNPSVNRYMSMPSYTPATGSLRATQGLGRALAPGYFALDEDEEETP